MYEIPHCYNKSGIAKQIVYKNLILYLRPLCFAIPYTQRSFLLVDFMKNKVEHYPVIYQPREHKLYVHIRNTPNSKGVYKKCFGVTCQTISARWGKNGKKYAIKNKDGEYTKFYKAILKYGWNKGFRHIILFKNLTKSEAYSLEYFFVKTYDTLKKVVIIAKKVAYLVLGLKMYVKKLVKIKKVNQYLILKRCGLKEN